MVLGAPHFHYQFLFLDLHEPLIPQTTITEERHYVAVQQPIYHVASAYRQASLTDFLELIPVIHTHEPLIPQFTPT